MTTETTDPQRRLWEPGIAGLIGHLADVTRPDAALLPDPATIEAPDDGPYAALHRRWGELRGPLARAGFPAEGDLVCVGAAEWGAATAEYEMAVLDAEADDAPDDETHRHDALVVTARGLVDDWLIEVDLARQVWGTCARAGLPDWVWPGRVARLFTAVQTRYDGWVQAAEGRVLKAFEAGAGDFIDAGDKSRAETWEAVRAEVTELIAAVAAG